ncbi:MAG: 5-formyltetrahydrofolate cyclo-ligase [Deltaproteobacteria bacterium]|nr:MAG: 5-formyltetrahydrofolate cyclo-ligase [Deltaproteobacteria bacterium]
MEEIQKTKEDIRNDIAKMWHNLSDKEINQKNKEIENRLFEFANFLEAKIALLYISQYSEVRTDNILKRCFEYNKILVLPLINSHEKAFKLMKIDDLDTDLKRGPNGIMTPDIDRCKTVPIECIDIAIIPGLAFDEKGGRIGSGDGYYDRLIPNLPVTTRKVSLAFDCQILPQVPTETHDKYVDIIITEKRIIYKI